MLTFSNFYIPVLCYTNFFNLCPVLGTVDSACTNVQKVTHAVTNWPDVSSISSKVSTFYNFMKPILKFFAKIQSILDKPLCLPNPLEKVRELNLGEYVQ